jgi:hypothetical protein
VTSAPGKSAAMSVGAAGSLWTFSEQLDFDEFLGRQYAFLNHKMVKLDAERAARPLGPHVSPGSMRILYNKERVSALR